MNVAPTTAGAAPTDTLIVTGGLAPPDECAGVAAVEEEDFLAEYAMKIIGTFRRAFGWAPFGRASVGRSEPMEIVFFLGRLCYWRR